MIPMWLRRCRRSATVLVALIVIVAGCGGDKAETSTSQTAVPASVVSPGTASTTPTTAVPTSRRTVPESTTTNSRVLHLSAPTARTPADSIGIFHGVPEL